MVFHQCISLVGTCPKELQIKQANTVQVRNSTSYLELQCAIRDKKCCTSLYYKHNSFHFKVMNYLFDEQFNIPEAKAYIVYHTKHILY